MLDVVPLARARLDSADVALTGGAPTPEIQAAETRSCEGTASAVNIVTLLPFIVLIGAMFLMTRSAKNKQRQAAKMRDAMQPGTGVRTIGGMYATVKEIRDDTVLLEVEPGTHALFAKNAVGAVLDDEEFDRIVNAMPDDLELADTVVPDDASSLTSDDDTDDESKVDFAKVDADEDTDADDADDTAADEAKGAETEKADVKEKSAEGDKQAKETKRKGSGSE
jgi:preprotein translocase subunit YajC